MRYPRTRRCKSYQPYLKRSLMNKLIPKPVISHTELPKTTCAMSTIRKRFLQMEKTHRHGLIGLIRRRTSSRAHSRRISRSSCPIRAPNRNSRQRSRAAVNPHSSRIRHSAHTCRRISNMVPLIPRRTTHHRPSPTEHHRGHRRCHRRMLVMLSSPWSTLRKTEIWGTHSWWLLKVCHHRRCHWYLLSSRTHSNLVIGRPLGPPTTILLEGF